MGWYRWASRIRVSVLVGVAVFALAFVLERVSDVGGAVPSALTLVGFVLVVVGLAVSFWPSGPSLPARSVLAPFAGRWVAINSPASKVPSHGTHAYGQTFAVDLVHEPAAGTRPEFGDGPAFRPPSDFPAFGRDVLAPADGTVVAARDRARDHRSRSSWLAYAYMFLDGAVRELFGVARILGNHVVLDLGNGHFALMAHLQRRSLVVRKGDRVRAGDRLGRCGNTGNSSEPHVHFQLMDGPNPLTAAGLPFSFTGAHIEGDGREGVPATGDAVTPWTSAA